MINDKLKSTLSNPVKFTTLSLAITMFEKVIAIFIKSGISLQTISFLQVGFDKITDELKQGFEFVKGKEDFNDLMGNNFKGEK